MSAATADNERQSEWAANTSEDTEAKDTQILAMNTQIKTLTNTFAALTKSMSNKENVPPRIGNTNTGNTPHPFNWRCNMGGYCWSHSHHPVSTNYNSSACTKKKMDTRMMQQPQTNKAVTTSGQTSTRSRNLSRSIPVSKENWHPPTERDWCNQRIAYIKRI